MDKHTLQQLKNQLTEEHDRILAQLKIIATPSSTIAGEWDASYPKFESSESGSYAMPTGRQADREEQEDELEEYEERLGEKSSLASQLLSITHALQRMEHRTYGTCKVCRNLIPLERLHANPAAEYDIAHEPKDGG